MMYGVEGVAQKYSRLLGVLQARAGNAWASMLLHSIGAELYNK